MSRRPTLCWAIREFPHSNISSCVPHSSDQLSSQSSGMEWGVFAFVFVNRSLISFYPVGERMPIDTWGPI